MIFLIINNGGRMESVHISRDGFRNLIKNNVKAFSVRHNEIQTQITVRGRSEECDFYTLVTQGENLDELRAELNAEKRKHQPVLH